MRKKIRLIDINNGYSFFKAARSISDKSNLEEK